MKKIHLIGICGVGMSATALLLKEAGYEVTGSDAECYGPPAATLKNAGIAPLLGYRPENIPEDADEIIIGRNAKLAPGENAEADAARRSGKSIKSFPEIIGELSRGRDTLVVAGSYGKSSTTALVAHILRSSGVEAGYFVGAVPAAMPPAMLGSALFVAEGDEYPTAHDDARPKFMHLHPRDVILTSVVHDHVNVYPTQASYEKPFAELLASVPNDGIVVCATEPNALRLAKASGKAVVSYGIENGDFHAEQVRFGERTTFTLVRDGVAVAELSTAELGRHAVENIVGAAAYLLSRDIVPVNDLQKAVASFGGVLRRLNNLLPDSRVPVYEGFGSSYEKARSAIEAMLLRFPDRPLVVVFEPHTFGWRNRANLAWYDDVFKGIACVYVAPPEKQGAGTHEQLSHEEILERAAGMVNARPYESPAQVSGALKENDVVLILTSGDLHGTLKELADTIQNRFAV